MSERDTTQATVCEETNTAKQPYCAPELRKLGRVSELTKTIAIHQVQPTDGAPAPLAYVS